MARTPGVCRPFQQVGGTEHVGGPSLQRVVVGAAHERLGGEMKNDLRPGLAHGAEDGVGITDVEATLVDIGTEQIPVIGRRAGGSAIPVIRAPRRCSQSASQLPLKPVCPVRRTRRSQ